MREFLLSEFRESTFKKIDKFSINTKMQECCIYENFGKCIYTHTGWLYIILLPPRRHLFLAEYCNRNEFSGSILSHIRIESERDGNNE